MSVYLSPGVFSLETDLSLYVPNLSTTALGIVGFASRGPLNEPTYVTNPVQFASTFGDPTDPDVAPLPAVYSALQYLHTGRQLYFVRVAELDPLYDPLTDPITEKYAAKYAATSLNEDSTAPTMTGTVNSLITFTSSNNVLKIIVDGSLPGYDLTFTLPISGSVVRSVPDVVSALNSTPAFATYLTASASSTGSLKITGKQVGSSHSIQLGGTAISQNVFGFTRLGSLGVTPVVFGTGTISEYAYILGSNIGSTITITDSVSDRFAVIMGTTPALASPTEFTVAPAVYASVDDLVTAINAISGFSTNLVASVFNGASGNGQVKIALKASSANTYLALGTPASRDATLAIFGCPVAAKYVVGSVEAPMTIVAATNDTLTFNLLEFSNGTSTPLSATVTAGTYATIDTLVTALNNNASFSAELDASKVTVGGNEYLKVALKNGSTYEGLTLGTGNGVYTVFGTVPAQKTTTTTVAAPLDVTAASAGTWGNAVGVEIISNVNGTFNLNVYEKGYFVESYKNLVMTPETIVDPLDPNGTIPNPAYVENAINGVSARITVTNNYVGDTLVKNTSQPKASAVGVKYALSGGSNGMPPTNTINPSTFIGVANGVEKTGLQFFANAEELDINLIAVPGVSDPSVINEMTSICTGRGDAMCLVDPPRGYTPQQIVDWNNGTGDFLGDHQAFNSSYAALYWPWLQVYDPVNKKKVWTPPSGHIAQVYAYTDMVADPWIAPAGLTRGRLVTPTKAEYNPTRGEMDLLYSNNVNVIATFARDGINVWGQKTLQRKPSALDRVNVRKLLLYLEKVITTTGRYILFEPDDAITWTNFVNTAEPFLQAVKDRRGVVDFKIRCDSTTNTADRVDRNEMSAIIYIKPTKAAEFLQVNFVLTAQGASFDELVF